MPAQLKRIAMISVCCALVFGLMGPGELCAQGAKSAPGVSSRTAVVLDSRTGTLLYSKSPDRRMYPASTTKVMTALLAIESGRMDEMVTVRWRDLQVVPTIIGLKKNERILLRDLVYGLLLRSGNDAARAIARHLAGSQAEFAKSMNHRASELGCKSTHFVNAHGLPNRYHYTTARDLGIIMREAMKNPEFRKVTATRHFRSSSSLKKRDFYNKNKLLKLYQGTTGGKSGYTRAAQQTLVATAKRDGHEVVIVCLHSYGKALWSDAIKLFDLGFDMIPGPRARLVTQLPRLSKTSLE